VANKKEAYMQKTLAPLGVVVRYITWRGHQIALHEAGTGPTILLVHSINAAASCYEMRKPFADLQDEYRVVAIDLLGYGDSDRPDMLYSAELYAELLADVAGVLGGVACIYAVSLSTAFACMAAAAHPEYIARVVLICPTGLVDLRVKGTVGRAYRLLHSQIGAGLYRLLTSRVSLRYFLRSMAYHNPAACDDAMVEACARAARHPGARYAPICFLTMLLNADLHDVLPRIAQPVLILWGQHAMTTPVTRMPAFLALLPQATGHVLPGAMAVQDECADEASRVVRGFLQTVAI
jgi:pimeloyl-ACP methyl ester carboxylesterase